MGCVTPTKPDEAEGLPDAAVNAPPAFVMVVV